MSFAWTPEKVEQLKTLWDRRLSAALIGEAMGISRRAVIGKSYRLDLPARVVEYTRANVPPLRRHRRDTLPCIKFKPPKPLPQRSASAPESLNVSLVNLTHKSCRYPTHETELLFCGVNQTPGSSYCGFHHGIAYQPPRSAHGAD